jgi:hypothetical protein
MNRHDSLSFTGSTPDRFNGQVYLAANVEFIQCPVFDWPGAKGVMNRDVGSGIVALLGLGLSCTAMLGQGSPIFTRVDGEPMTVGGGAQGIAWGDCNGDGWIDLFCAVRSSSSSTLFLNKGNGSFVRASGTVGANLVNPIGATWGDWNNKGALDLLISNNNGGNESLLVNSGDGTFSPVKSGSIVSSGGNSNGAAWGDYDRDGFLDVYITNSDGNNFLFHNNGDGTFKRITSGAWVSGTKNSQGCTWVDYDNDGYPDLYVLRYQSPNMLFHNERDGTFKQVKSGPMATEGGSALGFAWGDYDNDGLPDLFVANGSTNSLLHNEGGGVFKKVSSPNGTEPVSLETVNWIDYDNDGWLDLFGTSMTAGTSCRLYRNNGDGTFTRVTDSVLLTDPGRWFAAAWADIDNDGFLDVLVGNINNPNALYRNNGNSNHWLRVHCLGRVSNRAGIGAKVRARATIDGRTFWQMRELATGGNTADQDQLDPIIGLGDATAVETLRIEWPSGIVQELRNVPANQILQVKEPARIEAVPGSAPGQPKWNLRSANNVSYEIECSSDLRSWTRLNSLTTTGTLTTISDDTNHDIRMYRAVEP